MRMNRIHVWTLALAMGGSLAAMHPVKAVAQDQHDRDDDHDRDHNRNWHRHDRDHDRDRDDRDRDDRDRNRGWRGNGQYGRYPVYGNNGPYYGNGRYGNGPYGGYGGYGRGNAGSQIGYQDGLNDGRNDRATGHSFRPTQDSNYRHGDRGWVPNYGNKTYYQQSYRQAYMDGYQQGYGAQGYGYGYPRR